MSEVRVEEVKEKALKTLGMMLDFLGLNADFRAEEKGDNLVIKISSDNTGRIIGRKGQTLDSLQLLLNRIVFRGEEDGPRLMLDIDGYTRSSGREGGREGREGGDGRRRREGGRGRGGEDKEDLAARKEQLEQQALDAAKEVKRWGESVTLPKMNSHDRRIIHVTLQDDTEIETNSEGEGGLKKVIISLKKS